MADESNYMPLARRWALLQVRAEDSSATLRYLRALPDRLLHVEQHPSIAGTARILVTYDTVTWPEPDTIAEGIRAPLAELGIGCDVVDRGSVSAEDWIEIELAQDDLAGGRVDVRDHVDFFPHDAVGEPYDEDERGEGFDVRFAGVPGIVTTDIAGGFKMRLRCCDVALEFFRVNGLSAGDRIRIDRVYYWEYVVSPAEPRG